MANDWKVITVIGNIGSGKTTLTKRLAKTLKAKEIQADSLYLKNPFFPLAIKDRKRWSLASDLWFLNERVKIMENNLLSKQKLVIDSGLPMSWVYAHSRTKSGFYTEEEAKIYDSLNRILTSTLKPENIIVKLEADIDFLFQRIQTRGRNFELKHF